VCKKTWKRTVTIITIIVVEVELTLMMLTTILGCFQKDGDLM